MFFSALTVEAAESPWVDVHAIPQDLIEGVVSTFIGLMILFSIKPRLKIELLPVQRKDQSETSDTGNGEPSEKSASDPRSETFRFKVTNQRLRKVTEVKVRLWRVTRAGSRQAIDLVVDELFELRGRLSPLRPTLRSLLCAYFGQLSWNNASRANAKTRISSCRIARNRNKRVRARYTFYPKRETLESEIPKLTEGDFILFQAIARDALTGFTRLKATRYYRPDLEDVAGQAAASRQQSPAASGHSPTAST